MLDDHEAVAGALLHLLAVVVDSLQLALDDHDIVKPVAWKPLPVTSPTPVNEMASVH